MCVSLMALSLITRATPNDGYAPYGSRDTLIFTTVCVCVYHSVLMRTQRNANWTEEPEFLWRK